MSTTKKLVFILIIACITLLIVNIFLASVLVASQCRVIANIGIDGIKPEEEINVTINIGYSYGDGVEVDNVTETLLTKDIKLSKENNYEALLDIIEIDYNWLIDYHLYFDGWYALVDGSTTGVWEQLLYYRNYDGYDRLSQGWVFTNSAGSSAFDGLLVDRSMLFPGSTDNVIEIVAHYKDAVQIETSSVYYFCPDCGEERYVNTSLEMMQYAENLYSYVDFDGIQRITSIQEVHVTVPCYMHSNNY